jgi:hypothetical protein
MKHLIIRFVAILAALTNISPVPVSAQHLSKRANEEAEVLRQQAITAERANGRYDRRKDHPCVRSEERGRSRWSLSGSCPDAGKGGKYVRAREVAGRADNLDKRAVVLTYINRQEAEELIKQGELLRASRVIERIEDPEIRVEAVVSFAKTGRKKEPDLTRTVLEDTRKTLEKDAGSAAQSRAYLWLASSYAVFDPVLSFELMNSAVKFANKTKDFTALSSEMRLVHLSRKSDIAIPIGTSKGDFLPGFKLLGRRDF